MVLAAGWVGGIAAPVQAGPITIDFGLDALPSTGGQVSAVDLTGKTGQTSFSLNGGAVSVSIATSANQGVVQGNAGGFYAEPVTGGSQAAPTYWTTPYLSTGIAGTGIAGTITLLFATAQAYFGLLWGSVDYGATTNQIAFYSGSSLIGTITGNDVQAVTNSGASNGSQGYGGSYYTLLNDVAGTFNKVVLSSTVMSFELADFQYAAGNVSVPEPGSMGLLAVALAGLRLLGRRRARSSIQV